MQVNDPSPVAKLRDLIGSLFLLNLPISSPDKWSASEALPPFPQV